MSLSSQLLPPTTMFPTLMRRLADKPATSTTTARNTQILGVRYPGSSPGRQFKPKKVWPPDFSQLSEKEQFRFERRYKRRVKLATARPRWDNFMRLAQLTSITCKSHVLDMLHCGKRSARVLTSLLRCSRGCLFRTVRRSGHGQSKLSGTPGSECAIQTSLPFPLFLANTGVV